MKRQLLLWAGLLVPVAARAQGVEAPTQPSFGLDQVGILQGELWGLPLWLYVASGLWVALAFVVAPVIDFLMTKVLKRLTARTETELDDKLLEILHKPVKVLVVLLMLHAGLGMFHWPPLVERVLGTIFTLATAITLVYLAVQLVDLLMEYFAAKTFAGDPALARMMLPVLGKTFKVFVIIIGALTTAQLMGFPITSALAGLGVGGIAVALAAQSTLANVFGSITILTDQPFRVGDRVKIDAFEGMVERIGLRSTRIRTLEGQLVVIPNKTVADSAICNVTARPTAREQLVFSLTYDTPAARIEEALRILRAIFQRHPQTHDSLVYWKNFAPSSLDIVVMFWCKNPDPRATALVIEELNLEVKRQFDAAGLQFAFPTQTIHIHQAGR